MRFVVRLTPAVVALVLCTHLAAQAPPMTRFFVLPDTGPSTGSLSVFAGTEGTQSYSFDFTEDLRFNRGGFVTLAPNPNDPLVWDVVDFRLPASDTAVAIGSQMVFQPPSTPGPYGSWTSTDPTGFPDNTGVTVSMTGDLIATGSLAGVFATTQTLTLTGTITPGYYHNVILLTGPGFDGVPGGTVSLFMKNDFYPPAVKWEMALRSATSTADPGGTPTLPAVRGGFSMQRGVSNPNVYAILNVAMEVLTTPPIVISMPPLVSNAGILTFDPGTRGLTGSLNVLVDGSPLTIPVDGSGESFGGCVMHPTSLVIDEVNVGQFQALHLEFSTTELVPADSPIGDFQIGTTTSLVMRGRPGHIYGCAASFNPLPGVNTGVGDIPVMPDDLLFISIDPTNPYFLNMIGIMPPSGETQIDIALPNEPAIIGAKFFLGGGTFDPVSLDVLAATNSHRAVVK